MIRYLIALGMGPLTIIPIYYFSLRRTAEKHLWRILAPIAVVLSIIFGLVGIPASAHVTLFGLWALTMIGVGPMFLSLLGVEGLMVLDGEAGGITQHRRRIAAKNNSDEWCVEAVAHENDDELVEIHVKKGTHDRLIGSADPVNEGSLFHEHKARGEEMAATLNSLRVQVPTSTAVVARSALGIKIAPGE